MVDEQPNDVEQPGEPGDYENDVQGFQVKEAHTRLLQAVLVAPASTRSYKAS
jgi:hypothetical protein